MNEPLTPPDCDCRGLPFMPLEVTRFVDSDFTALSTGDEFKAAVILWAKSWGQVPAASIPDDDRILARMVGCSLAEWMTIKKMALHNWIACSDGRLYHPVIADLAIKAAVKRKGQSERANSRWAKAKAGKQATVIPQTQKPDATAQESGATVMQVKGTVKGTEPPLAPQGEAELDLTPEPEKPEPPDEVRQAFDLWNETAALCGLPRAKVLDDARRRSIRKRIEHGGIDLWRQAMDAIQVSAFMRGQRPGSDGRIFKADLTFVCQAKSFQRLVDGGYGEDAEKPISATADQPTSPNDIWRRRVETFTRNQYWNRYDWGPAPGKAGCEAPAEALAAFGFGGAEVVPFPLTEGRAA